MRLFLVRHGQTAANTRLELDTAFPGSPLTELGREQAAALPRQFEGVGIDLIMASTLVRTQQTAEPLAAARELEPVIDAQLREIIAGDLEMRNDDEAIRIYHETVEAWSYSDLDPRMPGAEDGHETVGRFTAGIERGRDVVGNDGTLAVFAHGAIIRMWSRHQAVNADFERFHIVQNTGIVEMSDDDGAWRIVTWQGEPA